MSATSRASSSGVCTGASRAQRTHCAELGQDQQHPRSDQGGSGLCPEFSCPLPPQFPPHKSSPFVLGCSALPPGAGSGAGLHFKCIVDMGPGCFSWSPSLSHCSGRLAVMETRAPASTPSLVRPGHTEGTWNLPWQQKAA